MDRQDARDVVESVPGAALAVDGDGQIAAGNDSSSVVFGAPIERIEGSSLTALVDDGYFEPALLDRYEDSRSTLADGAEETTFRVDLSRANDLPAQPYEVRVTAYEGEQFDGTVWSLRDVGTDERYAETVEALHRATRQLVAADAIREVYEVCGRAANEVLGFPGVGVREYEPDDEQLRFVTFGGKVEDIDSRPTYDVANSPHGEAFRAEETVVQGIADSDPYDREVFSHVMYVPIGEFGVLSVGKISGGFDDADRQFAEILAENTGAALASVSRRERLREQGRQLERQNERLEEFAGVVAHDIRNPLGLAEGAFRSYRETGDPERAETVEYALDRANSIVDEVLALARQGRTVENPVQVELSSVAAEAWENVDTGAATLSAAEVDLSADRNRLLRLLENLFRNAAEHGHADEVTVGRLDGGFYVADDGDGIDSDERDHAFDLGYTTADEGTGFGLAIVEEIAGAHGWTVDLLVDGGTRFEFTGVD